MRAPRGRSPGGLQGRLESVLRRAWSRIAPRTFALCGRPTDTELGLVGEELAARALRRDGLQVVARRLRTPRAELDLVALDGAVLVVVEVKTGRAPTRLREAQWRPADRVRTSQRRRLERAARWLASRRRARRFRVDLVEVLVDTSSRRVEIRRETGESSSGVSG